MIKKYLIIIILTISNLINAQNLDSLRNLAKSGNPEKQIAAMIKLSNYYFYSIPDSAKFYLSEARQIAEDNNLSHQLGVINLNFGILYNEEGLLSIAQKYFDETLKIAKETQDSSIWVAALGNLGNAYLQNGNYAKALEYFTQIVNFYQADKNYPGLGNTYGAIGNVYYYTGDYDQALHYYDIANQYFLMSKDTISAAIVAMNEASIYLKKNDYQSAEKQYNEAIKIFQKYNIKKNEAKCNEGLAELYMAKNDFYKAIKYLDKAVELYKETKSQKDLGEVYLQIAYLYSQQKNTAKAKTYLDKAYNLAIELDNLVLLSKSTEALKKYYEQNNDYKNAYKFAELNRTYSDSLNNIESMKKLKELKVKFETEQKEQQIEVLKKEKQIAEEKNKRQRLWIIILIISAFSSIGIFGLLYNRKKLVDKHKEILLQQKLNRLQMNPHFIFNSLMFIQNFLLQNDSEQAAIYLADFSRLMRKILESTRADFISIDEEIEILDLYVKLQKLNTKNKFNFILDIDEKIDMENVLIPPMLIQPFIENSIKYAFDEDSDNPEIKLKIVNTGKQLKIEISDNGKGFDPRQKNKKHKSLAIDITKERLKNIFFKKNINFTIENLTTKGGKGTKVTIIIPLIEEF